MAFGGSTNIPLGKSSANGVGNGSNGGRSRELRIRSNQEKISNECNIIDGIDCNETNGGEEVFDQEEEEAYIQMYLELQKRKALESKLKGLQKKKDKMDNILKELLLQQQRDQRGKNGRYNLNCTLQSARYDADGSEEDEIRIKQLIGNSKNGGSGSLVNGYVTEVRQRNLNIAAKLRELEQVELKLKQVESLMRSIQEPESEDIQAVPEATMSPVNNTSQHHHHHNHQRSPHNRDLVNRKSLNDENKNDRPSNHRHGSKGAKNNALDGRRNTRRGDNLTAHRRSVEETYRVPVYHGPETTNDDNCELNGPLATSPHTEESVIEMEASHHHHHQSRDNFLQSMQSNFDSLKNVIENNEPWNQNVPISNHQFFYLMLTQNYQILQQQQMLLLWLQQQSQQQNCSSPYCRSCESALGEGNFPSPPPPVIPGWPASANNSSSFGSHFLGATGGGPRNQPGKVMTPLNQMADMPDSATLNNKVAPGMRANNYWDNFKSNPRQNQLGSNGNGSRSSLSKSNENLIGASSHLPANGLASNFNSISLPKSIDTGVQESSSAPTSATISSKASFSVSHLKKSAHQQSYQQHEHGMEKIKNTPLNDSPPGRVQPGVQNDISTLLSMLGKFMNNDNKRDVNSGNHGSIVGGGSSAGNSSIPGLTQPKVKPSNISLSQMEEGAIGGEEIPSSNTEKERDLVPTTSLSSNPRLHQTPLHIPASTGAIRKKLRNPDVIESAASKPDKQKGGGGDDMNSLLSETTRPLMAAEGRSSEVRPIANAQASLPSVKSSQPSLLLLRQRPPTTGATGRDDNEENLSYSSDDDLEEPEQPELSEAEADHSNTSMMGAMQGISVVSICDSNNKSDPKGGEVEGDDDDDDDLDENEEDEEEEDNIPAPGVEEIRMRLSGDGEQGL